MIRKFRPFWSYDIIKTETWLNKMSLNGYHLKHINFISKIFIFEKGERKSIHYRICYEKYFNGQIPAQMIDAGWECVLANTRFYVVRTICENPSATPSYQNVLDRNKKIEFVVGIILLIMLCFQLPLYLILFILIISALTGNLTVEVDNAVEIAPQMIDIFLGTLIPLSILLSISWLVYTYFRLRASNKNIEKICFVKPKLSFTIPKDGLLSKTEEKLLLKSKKLIRKRKIAWFYAPDKAEHWLEDMESKGYNLYRMSKPGNCFYFLKVTPRKIKYVVDYQNKTGSSYYDLNTECGWKLIFTSLSSYQAITVWSHEYTQDECEPEFYSDYLSKLKHARKFALSYSLCFFPICVLYIALIIFEISMGNDYPNFWLTISLQTPIVIVNGSFSFRTLLYYFRIRKSLNIKSTK